MILSLAQLRYNRREQVVSGVRLRRGAAGRRGHAYFYRWLWRCCLLECTIKIGCHFWPVFFLIASRGPQRSPRLHMSGASPSWGQNVGFYKRKSIK